MSEKRQSIHGQWSSRWIFILAATGSAVGLGNIWKFPYITGENGGGAFVLVYLVCIALVGVPIMVAEIMLGRRGRQSPLNTMKTLAQEAGKSAHWRWAGAMGIASGFLILSFYSVIAGWAVFYVFRAASGAFTGASADDISALFGDLLADPLALLGWHTLFILMTVGVVARGVKSGLEQAVRYLMPGLFILLVVLVGYAMSTGAFDRGIEFLFAVDFSKLKAESVLTAMGHAFFTLSLGMGAIMIYGSYLPQNASIGASAITIALADTAVALLAGMAIFPIVFANGLEPGSGPGLVFQTLPLAFGQMPGGVIFGTLFFVLLVIAAWSSSISIVEPVVAWLVENHGFSRVSACGISGGVSWLLGIGTILSFNYWADVKVFFGYTFFEAIDKLTANIMLPLGGLLIAIFAGWVIKRADVEEELAVKNATLFNIWYFTTRYITPALVVVVFLHAVGLFPDLTTN